MFLRFFWNNKSFVSKNPSFQFIKKFKQMICVVISYITRRKQNFDNFSKSIDHQKQFKPIEPPDRRLAVSGFPVKYPVSLNPSIVANNYTGRIAIIPHT